MIDHPRTEQPIRALSMRALINLRNDLKIEMEDQETSRSIRNYKKELMDATVMVIKHYKKNTIRNLHEIW